MKAFFENVGTMLVMAVVTSLLFLASLLITSIYPEKELTQLILIAVFYFSGFLTVAIGTSDGKKQRAEEQATGDTAPLYHPHDHPEIYS